MYQLEKYRGSRSRYTCPRCGKSKEFARYIDESGDYIDETVGRCNRESSCGYHLTPKEYFDARGSGVFTREQTNRVNRTNALNKMNTVNTMNEVNTLEHFDVIDNSFVVRSLEYTKENRFLNFLLSFIDARLVQKAAKDYLIGTTRDGRTIF